MEYAQRAVNARHAKLKQCLNPYFNGTCSKSYDTLFFQVFSQAVLILILMEHAQREEIYLMECFTICNSLNPYFNGTCSKSAR